MIPILYYPEENVFAAQGIGALTDCLRCEVTEERNGPYTLELDYPITGKWYSEIQEGRLVTAWHDDRHDAQPFEIYARTAPISGIVTFYGRHISYRLNNVIVGPFQATSIAAAMAGLKSHALTQCPFTFWTDRETAATFRVRVPSACRSLLGGTQGSILDTFGHGEYMFDRFAVRMYANRGTDAGVVIEYGKNLTDLTQDKSIETMYTAAAPYWSNDDGTEVVTIPGLVVAPELETKRVTWTTQTGEDVTDQNGEPIDIRYGIIRAVPMDLSGDFDEAPTEEQLRDLAQRRLNNSTAWRPKDGLRVSFAQLWQTEEYKNIAPLERVALCDIVTVHHRALGVSAKMKVTRVVYDTLRERYASMELGTTGASLAQTIRAETEIALQERPTRSMMAESIDHATELIRGGLGGYVVIGTDPDGQPDEILIMDAPTIAEAVNVWRFNKGGLGHSSTGYNGPYSDIALTADGKINASLIQAGELNANIIKAGVLQDLEGRFYLDMSTGELRMRDGSFSGQVEVTSKMTVLTPTGEKDLEMNGDGLDIFTVVNGQAIALGKIGVSPMGTSHVLALKYSADNSRGALLSRVNSDNTETRIILVSNTMEQISTPFGIYAGGDVTGANLFSNGAISGGAITGSSLRIDGKSGISGTITAGGTTYTFTNGILTGIS